MAGFSYILQIAFMGASNSEVDMMKSLCEMALGGGELNYCNERFFETEKTQNYVCTASFYAYSDEKLSNAPKIIADLFPNSEFCYRIVRHYDSGGEYSGLKAEYSNNKLRINECDTESEDDQAINDIEGLIETNIQNFNKYEDLLDMNEEDLQILSYVECFYSLHNPIELLTTEYRNKGAGYTESFRTKEELISKLVE